MFYENKLEKEIRRKEQELEARQAELYKTIGKLTNERDSLPLCGKSLEDPTSRKTIVEKMVHLSVERQCELL